MTGPSSSGVKPWFLLPCETPLEITMSCCVGGSCSSPKYLHYPFWMWHSRKAGERASYLSQKCPKFGACDGERSVSRAQSLQLGQWAKQGNRAVRGSRYRAEQGGDKRDHGEESIKGEWGMQSSTCYSRGGFRKKSFVLVKIFVNPSLLEHRIVLQGAEWLAEEEVLRKVSFLH